MYSSLVSWKIPPLYFFSLNKIYFAQKKPIKVKILKLSSAQIKICQIPYVSFETTSRFLSKFCIPLQFHERLLLCTFLSQTIYTLLKRSALKWKFLRLDCSGQNLSNFLCQFWSWFLSYIWIPLQFHERWLLCTIISSNNIYFAQKEPIKMKIFETFKCSGQNSSNSSCQLWNDKSVPLQIFYNSWLWWQITPLWILSPYFFKF